LRRRYFRGVRKRIVFVAPAGRISVPRDPLAAHPTVWDGSDQACRGCGYGVAAGRLPDRCPMCGGSAWRPRAVRPPEAWDPSMSLRA